MRIVDVWAQHATPRFIRHEMFESLAGGPAPRS